MRGHRSCDGNGLEILTAGGGWPTISVYGYQRPAVLKFYEA